MSNIRSALIFISLVSLIAYFGFGNVSSKIRPDHTPSGDQTVVRQIIGNNNPGGRTATGCTGIRTDFQLQLSPPDPPNVPLLARQVSLTYDDGPGPHTLSIANYLAAKRIPATFFMNGCRFRSAGGCEQSPFSPSLIQAVIDLGHRVGNHTETHPALWQSGVDILTELKSTQTLLDPNIKDGFFFFRPPFNCWTPEAEQIVRGDTQLRKLTGPFFYDSAGADWRCSQPGVNWVPAACALNYYRDMPAEKRGIIQLHDRNPNDVSSDYAFQVTKCLVEGIGSSACPDPGSSAFAVIPGGAPTPDERSLFASFQFVPLDAIPGVTSGQFAVGSFVSAGFVRSELSDAAGWSALPSYYETIRIGDVNGDGIGDVCARGPAGVICALGLGNGAFGSFMVWSTALSDDQGYAPAEYGTTFQLADVNGDGKADACVRSIVGVECLLSTGTSFGTRFGTPEFSDAFGWRTSRSHYGSIRFADINGDGRADVCGRGTSGIICVLSAGQSFGQPSYWLTSEFTDAFGWLPEEYGSTIQLADINGDGRADICGRGIRAVYCATSTGSAFSPTSVWTDWQFTDAKGWASGRSRYGSFRLADINGDGLADACGRDSNGAVCAVAVSGRPGFFYPRYIVNTDLFDSYGWIPPQYGATLAFGPLRSGSRRADICARGITGLVCWLSRY